MARAQLQPGEDVLVLAASSGVGSAAIQMAKLFQCRVIATAGGEEKMAKARELGADQVIDHYRQDISAEVRKITAKRGVDVVVEQSGVPLVTRKGLASLAILAIQRFAEQYLHIRLISDPLLLREPAYALDIALLQPYGDVPRVCGRPQALP
ncbi:MAG: zinc-binding dehydrogenase [Bryobacteraceae bacterium]